MAAKDAKKTLRFKMSFPQRVTGDPIMHRLSRKAGVVPNIIRGRITEKGAWLEVQLEGAQKNIDKALKLLRNEGVNLTSLDD